ncbi:hypothetical protein TRFO_05422 [Tritrichomonas foetus]|uniref:Uncharacterized protein n=1 Tax=Tritrichomonas foetus TaxID=1144522 RepID=A0A1J4KAQ0_9EUKA|nr:hypothetical protein TRFO_05422 [Tritrichomonas foetus]|eukprot:OHT06750.1 hypothetical protein TRFO_05422 [Tritrichomonas foetus]
MNIGFFLLFTTFAIITGLISISLYTVGALMAEFKSSGSILSIPLYPTAKNGLCQYVGVIPDGRDIYSIDNVTNFTINFPFTLFNDISSKQDLYIIHNLWGYNFNVSVTSIKGKTTSFGNFYRNDGLNRSNDVPVEDIYLMSQILPDDMKKYNKYFVFCPVSTLATKDLQIEPECNSTFGALTSFRSGFQTIRAGEVDIGQHHASSVDVNNHDEGLKITFTNLTANPMNYINPPMMFVALWKGTISRSLINGATTLLIVSASLMILAYFV